jgi:hypothetical protein
MDISVNSIDSAAFGRKVLDIRGASHTDDLVAAERVYRAAHDPIYVSLKVPVEDLRTLHAAEDAGFRFVEVQLRLTHRLTKPFAVGPQPYRFERVTTNEALAPVLEIASTGFTEDRFSSDPFVPASISGERYRAYVAKSFATGDERVYRLVNAETDETVAFKTHRITSPTEVLCLLGAVKPAYRGTPLPVINEYYEFNMLRESGIKQITTHVSVRNYGVTNLEIGRLGFKIAAASVVLRKWYGSAGG